MYDVFDEVKNILKVSPINTDNTIFRLHYKATMIVLIACSILVTQKQYFGDPIDCVATSVDTDILDTFCWIHSTFTMPKAVGAHVVHAGVAGKHNPVTGKAYETKHHKYYQWVVIVLVLQAFMFYLPKYIWVACEGGKINMLAADLNTPIVADDTRKERKEMMVNYCFNNLNGHNFYAYKFFFCEVLNFINVIAQMFLTDRFLGGEFLEYGTNVINVSEEDIGTRSDPMDLVFPKVAKCTFRNYGASGSIETKDGLCVLPLNVLNEKIYIFLWFWFIIVAVITGLSLVYRLVTIFLPSLRIMLLKVRCPLVDSSYLNDVAHKSDIGDWFLLYMLSKNIDPLIFRDFIHELAMKMRGNGPIG